MTKLINIPTLSSNIKTQIKCTYKKNLFSKGLSNMCNIAYVKTTKISNILLKTTINY